MDEVIINNRRVKLENGQIYSYYIIGGSSKVCKWYPLKGTMNKGNPCATINGKRYSYRRIVFKIFNPEWSIENSEMIKHYDKNILNNRIENLYRVL